MTLVWTRNARPVAFGIDRAYHHLASCTSASGNISNNKNKNSQCRRSYTIEKGQDSGLLSRAVSAGHGGANTNRGSSSGGGNSSNGRILHYFSTTDDSAAATVTVAPTAKSSDARVDRILVTASLKAGQLLALPQPNRSNISNTSNSTSVSTSSTISSTSTSSSTHSTAAHVLPVTKSASKGAMPSVEATICIDAAKTLLLMTSKSSFRDVIAKNLHRKEVKELHRAFITVTSRCLLFPAVTHQHCLGLAMRSSQMGLPLTLPMYESIAAGLAQHTRNLPCKKVLDLASTARVSLHLEQPLECSFFTNSLVALARRRKLKEVLLLLRTMEDRDDLHSANGRTALTVLDVLSEMILRSENNNNNNNNNIDDDISLLGTGKFVTEACELQDRLKEILIGEWKEQKIKNLKRLEDVLDGLVQEEEDGDSDEMSEEVLELMSQLDPSSDDEVVDGDDGDMVDDEFSDDDDDDDDDDENSPYRSTFHNNRHSNNNATGSFLPSLRRSNKEHNEMVKDMIYLRDYQRWEIPDVTSQLQRNNLGRDVLYTKQFEEYLLNEEEESDDDF